MDRFIDRITPHCVVGQCYLKSNMDRFIVFINQEFDSVILYLKSNMDRFIASVVITVLLTRPI